MTFCHLARMGGIAAVVESRELLFEPRTFLAELGQRCLDCLDLLAPGSEVAARAGVLAPLLTAVAIVAGFGGGRSGRGTGTFLQPSGVVLEIAVEVAHHPVGHQPELVADTAQQATV